jgi:hypothetical protein
VTWIESIHPGSCKNVLVAPSAADNHRDDSSTVLLLAHCIQHHALPLGEAARIFAASFWLPSANRDVIDAIRPNAESWAISLLQDWETLMARPRESPFADLFALALGRARWAPFWQSLWASARPESGPAWFMAIAWQVLFDPEAVENPPAFMLANLRRPSAIDLQATENRQSSSPPVE